MRILIADDEQTAASLLSEMLRNFGHDVVDIVGTGLDAIRSYHIHKPDLVLMDLVMARYNGATASRMILGNYPSAKIVVLSGHLNNDNEWTAAHCGAIATLAKPFQMERLKQVLDRLEQPIG